VKLLVLGGTVFLGPHVVSSAVARGHSVTMFNRGVHNPDLFPGVERVRGDRNVDLSVLSGRQFDAVIDTSGYAASQIRAAADVLERTVEHYLFISSISVYARFPPGAAFDEQAATLPGDEGYGANKARCEEVLESRFGGRAARVRPGLVVGPRDPTDRFTYWPRRVAAGGRVLAPGRPDRPVQFIDVRDLAGWCVQLAERRVGGVFNAVGPSGPLTMGGLLDECVRELGSGAEFVWLPDAALLEAGVQPWTELPLWIPESDPDHGGMLLASNSRAVGAGLTFQPIADTIRATFDWDRREGATQAALPIRVTPIERDKEMRLLALTAAP
jgi:2'-hydroxyisoflavone reductase